MKLHLGAWVLILCDPLSCRRGSLLGTSRWSRWRRRCTAGCCPTARTPTTSAARGSWRWTLATSAPGPHGSPAGTTRTTYRSISITATRRRRRRARLSPAASSSSPRGSRSGGAPASATPGAPRLHRARPGSPPTTPPRPPRASSTAWPARHGGAPRSETGTRSSARGTWPAPRPPRPGRGATARRGNGRRRTPSRRRGRASWAEKGRRGGRRARMRTAAGSASSARTWHERPASLGSASATRRPETTTWTAFGDVGWWSVCV